MSVVSRIHRGDVRISGSIVEMCASRHDRQQTATLFSHAHIIWWIPSNQPLVCMCLCTRVGERARARQRGSARARERACAREKEKERQIERESVACIYTYIYTTYTTTRHRAHILQQQQPCMNEQILQNPCSVIMLKNSLAPVPGGSGPCS